jgi:hypothetical protein
VKGEYQITILAKIVLILFSGFMIINQFYYFRVSIDNKRKFYFSNERELE